MCCAVFLKSPWHSLGFRKWKHVNKVCSTKMFRISIPCRRLESWVCVGSSWSPSTFDLEQNVTAHDSSWLAALCGLEMRPHTARCYGDKCIMSKCCKNYFDMGFYPRWADLLSCYLTQCSSRYVKNDCLLFSSVALPAYLLQENFAAHVFGRCPLILGHRVAEHGLVKILSYTPSVVSM